MREVITREQAAAFLNRVHSYLAREWREANTYEARERSIAIEKASWIIWRAKGAI